MKQPTFKPLSARLNSILKDDDVQAQMKLAKAEQSKLRSARRMALENAQTLDKKLEIRRTYDQAILGSQQVLRALRLRVFDIEDALKEGLSASSIL